MFDTLVDNSTDPERRSEFLFKRAEVEITRLSNRARGIETLREQFRVHRIAMTS